MTHSDILDRLASGELTAEEATRLLREPASSPAGKPSPDSLGADYANRRLRVRVTNLDTGRDRVNVNLPLALVEAGVKLGARYEPGIAGVNFAELVEQIKSGVSGNLVEVDNWEEGERVEIFIE